jgi:hypothetical protein
MYTKRTWLITYVCASVKNFWLGVDEDADTLHATETPTLQKNEALRWDLH